MNDRRKFIVNSCTMCVGVLVGGTLLGMLSGCSSLSVYKTTADKSNLIIPVSEFLPEEKMKIIRAANLDFDVLLVRKDGVAPYALLMKCTHQDNPLVTGGTMLTCNSHGSTFDLNGNVTKGPADEPLRKFIAVEENNNITIHLT